MKQNHTGTHAPAVARRKRPASPASGLAKSRRHAAVRLRIKKSRPLHRQLALHPITLFCLLVIGVFITGWTLRAAADTYSLSAKVPAAPLTVGAIITSPASGTTVTSNSATVTGTCPDNSYITLSRNGVFSGVAWCNADHTFSITTALSEGGNLIFAQDFTTTDDPGPTSPSITIIYTPPVQQVPPAGNTAVPITPAGNTSAQAVVPLLITSDYRFRAFATGTTFSWTLSLTGGEAPYRLAIAWGDNTTSTSIYNQIGPATITHRYLHAGYFPVTVRVTDASETTTMLQLAALIKSPGAGGLLSQDNTTGGDTSFIGQLLQLVPKSGSWLLLAWPSYGVALLMVASFWLGERQMLREAFVVRTPVRVAGHHQRK